MTNFSWSKGKGNIIKLWKERLKKVSAFRNLIAVAMFNVWVYFAVSNLLLFQSGISEPEYDIAFSRLLPIFGGFLFRFRRIWSQIKSLGFRKIGLGGKVSVSVSENLVSDKSLGFSFRKYGLRVPAMNCLYTVYAICTVYTVYTIQTTPSCLNSGIMHA